MQVQNKEIIISGMDEAKVYKPKKPTYIISIVDDWYFEKKDIEELDKNFKNDLIVFDRYKFEDATGPYSEFTKDIAKNLIDNFVARAADKKILYFHCFMGMSRSPATAAAINEIFEIDVSRDIKKEYYLYNTDVYDVLIDVAKTNKYGRFSFI